MDIAQDAPETVILAEDEASLYLQATTMRVWAPVGQTPSVRVHTGREQTHFYGSLNLLTGDEVVMQTDTMNSETTAIYLQMIAEAIPDKPILLLWDRATWHGGDAVRAFLKQNPRFEVMRFPPGSPDLNPQEHVWKLTREQVSHNHLQTQFNQLVTDFLTYLRDSTFESSFLKRYGYCPISN
jgi:transposase